MSEESTEQTLVITNGHRFVIEVDEDAGTRVSRCLDCGAEDPRQECSSNSAE